MEMTTGTDRKTLIPQSNGLLRLLRLGLLLSCFGWGISFSFTFVSWSNAADQLSMMGADYIEYCPMLDYWLKMASATFGCIGIASAVACLWPVRFEALVWLLGPFHAFIGVVLTLAARSNHLSIDQHPTFVADITFCFSTALLIGMPLLVGIFRKDSPAEAAVCDGDRSTQ